MPSPVADHKSGLNVADFDGKCRDTLDAVVHAESYDDLSQEKGITFPALRNATTAALKVLDRTNPTLTRSHRIAEVRQQYPHAYEPWAEQDDQLIELSNAGQSPAQIADELGRQTSAVCARLRQISLCHRLALAKSIQVSMESGNLDQN